MKEWTGAYVCHVCKKCNCAFVAEDYTNARDIPPHWRYCPDCAKELGIDYKKQKPWNNFSEARKKHLEKFKKIGNENLKKISFRQKTKH